MAVDSYEIFEEFFRRVKAAEDIEEVIREYGGSSIYVPSYKNTHRNERIYKMWLDGVDIRTICREFELSESRVRGIIKDMRQRREV